MGLTIAQKIIKAHLVEGDMTPGSEIALRIDQTLKVLLKSIWILKISVVPRLLKSRQRGVLLRKHSILQKMWQQIFLL